MRPPEYKFECVECKNITKKNVVCLARTKTPKTDHKQYTHIRCVIFFCYFFYIVVVVVVVIQCFRTLWLFIIHRNLCTRKIMEHSVNEGRWKRYISPKQNQNNNSVQQRWVNVSTDRRFNKKFIVRNWVCVSLRLIFSFCFENQRNRVKCIYELNGKQCKWTDEQVLATALAWYSFICIYFAHKVIMRSLYCKR